MQFFSTNDTQHRVDFADAIFRGLAPDQGLYMPDQISTVMPAIAALPRDADMAELAYVVTRGLLPGVMPEVELRGICERCARFDAPLVPVGDRYLLELFHGPTRAFKDFGASFLAQLLSWLNRDAAETLHILVATSGDTGGAVAAGFHRVPGIEVTILFPKGKVSPLQEKQLTTWGDNVHAVAIDGAFDDCQRLVKAAFLDETLRTQRRLSSANSINLGRLIAQTWYYARAWQQLPAEAPAPIFCVPSGNFGNLTAGLWLHQAGLPVQRFVAATNANDVVPQFLHGQPYATRASVPTLSNAMDVGNPSNVARIRHLLGADRAGWLQVMDAESVSDADTLRLIRQVYEQEQYVLDPHAAVGWGALDRLYPGGSEHPLIVLGTAHPGKFAEVTRQALEQDLPLPEDLAATLAQPGHYERLSGDFAEFRDYLLGR